MADKAALFKSIPPSMLPPHRLTRARFVTKNVGTKYNITPCFMAKPRQGLPGNSGQQVLITPATLGPHARILFDTMNLARAKRHLAHEHIPTAKLPNNAGVLITDPDGNQLYLLQR